MHQIAIFSNALAVSKRGHISSLLKLNGTEYYQIQLEYCCSILNTNTSIPLPNILHVLTAANYPLPPKVADFGKTISWSFWLV